MASVPDPTCAPVRVASSLPAVDQELEVSNIRNIHAVTEAWLNMKPHHKVLTHRRNRSRRRAIWSIDQLWGSLHQHYRAENKCQNIHLLSLIDGNYLDNWFFFQVIFQAKGQTVLRSRLYLLLLCVSCDGTLNIFKFLSLSWTKDTWCFIVAW